MISASSPKEPASPCTGRVFLPWTLSRICTRRARTFASYALLTRSKEEPHCGYPVVSPQEAAAKCLEANEVDTIIITSGAVPAISATLEQLGVATYVSVGSLLRKVASKPPDVHFATRISDIPGEMAWKAWGHASELERLKSIVEGSRPGLIASYTIIPDADGATDDEDAANAQPEAPLLLIGSGQYEIFKTQGHSAAHAAGCPRRF